MGILLALLSSISFGLSQVCARVGLLYINPKISTFISVSTSFALVSIVTAIFDLDSLIRVSFVGVLWFALLGILNFTLARTLLFIGTRAIGASKATAISASNPLFSIILAVTILGENITVPLILGTLFIIGGLFVLLKKNGENVVSVKFRAWGYFFSIASALCYGVGLVITKWGVSEITTPLAGCTISLAFGSLALLFVVGRRGFNFSVKADKRAIGFISASGLFSALGLIFLFYAMSVAPAIVVSPLYGTYPLFTLLGVHLFLQRLERSTNSIVIGCFVVVIGGILITLGTFRG